MNVLPTPTIQPAYGSGSGSGSDRVNNSDFDTFLKMLTTQVENQDPLDPIKSEDCATQLAQSSAVEQQTKTNDLLEALNAQFGQMGMAELANWVDMEARVAAPASFDGGAISVAASPVTTANRAFLVVRDQSGVTVDRREIPVTEATLEWDGRDSDNTELPKGLYAFEIESQHNGDFLDTKPAEVYAPVTEARNQEGGTYLVLRGGTVVDAGAVRAIREPNAA